MGIVIIGVDVTMVNLSSNCIKSKLAFLNYSLIGTKINIGIVCGSSTCIFIKFILPLVDRPSRYIVFIKLKDSITITLPLLDRLKGVIAS